MAKHTLELFLALSIAGAALVLGGAPLFLVKGSPRGDIMVVQDFMLHMNSSTGSAFWNGTVNNLCVCRNKCWAEPVCVTFSYDAQDRQCILADKGPHHYFFKPSPGSIIAYTTRAFAYSSYWMGPEGYFYAVSNFGKTFTDAKLTCASIPGHRLAIFHRMSQYNVLVEIIRDMGANPQLWVDLRSFPDGLKWGDGTYYSATELQGNVTANYISWMLFPLRTLSGTLNDFDSNAQLKFVCQAAPSGKGW